MSDPCLPPGTTESDISRAADAPPVRDMSWEEFSARFPKTAEGIERAYYQRAFEALMEMDDALLGSGDPLSAVFSACQSAANNWRVYSREQAIKFLADRADYNAPYAG